LAAFRLKTPPDRLSGATCGNVGEDGLYREMASQARPRPAEAIIRITPGQKIHRPPHTGGNGTTTPSLQKSASIRSTAGSQSPKAYMASPAHTHAQAAKAVGGRGGHRRHPLFAVGRQGKFAFLEHRDA